MPGKDEWDEPVAKEVWHGIRALPQPKRLQGCRHSPAGSGTQGRFRRLEVAERHTYHVGGCGVLVHNDCDYEEVLNPKNAGEGKDFTRRQKREFLEANMRQNGGKLVDDVTGEECVPPSQSRRGVVPPANEATIDQVKPKSKGGTNTSDNAQVRTRRSNREKSDRWP
ncbi:MAG: hypothetical protein LBG81_01695 [Coriobacteriaceae bacterium]|nr:hypothetical protein [Coriobacteriaceae bacterium]